MPFNPTLIGQIAIKVKVRAGETHDSAGVGLTTPPVLHPKENEGGLEKVKTETVVLLMDLTATEPFKENGRSTILKRRKATANVKWSGYIDGEPADYFIHVRGCTWVQYPVLYNFNEPFRMLLDIITKNQPPRALRELEDRMMAVMYPVERLTTKRERE